MRILIAEDSPVLRDSLTQGLREAGYAVDAVADGRRALIYAQATDYDVIILDWMLPELDGLTVLSRIRAQRPASVLMLTARDTLDDKVRGLTTGADDYLVKPFAFKELLARVQALARRRHAQPSPAVRIGPLSLDTAARTAHIALPSRSPAPLNLTPREFSLLEYLAARAGRPATRAELEEHLYDDRSRIFSNAIDSAIAALRAKLDAAGCPPIIHTRRKIGYVLKEDGP